MEMNLEQAEAAILAKMRAQRPTLRAYLQTMQQVTTDNMIEWNEAGDKVNAAYHNGQWYAYRDIERMIENDGFAPEP